MSNFKIVLDTINVAVNQSNPLSESKDNDVTIVAIIAGCSLAAIIVVCLLIYFTVRLKKYNGIKSIVEEILEDKAKQDKKNGKQA